MFPDSHAKRETGARGRISLWVVWLTLAAGGVFAVAGLVPWEKSGAAAPVEGAQVRRGPLRISVTASGSLRAAHTVSLASGIAGRTTILSIVPDGSTVQEGDVVCELDATAMSERRIEQSITVGNADASLVKARQNHRIQESQNRSDVEKARQTVSFAEQDLQMFLEGERGLELEKASQAIDLAKEEAQRAQDRLAWSEKLAAQGFLTTSELEADRIATHRADVDLQRATRELDLLERFRMPRRETELRGALDEARREAERVDLQARARIVDFESDLRAAEATLALEQEKLARLDSQIDKARIRAPRDGFVVYAQRDTDEPPIQAGAEVREREEVLSIPSRSGMKAEVKLHESVLKKVQPGQRCSVKVDALAGADIEGEVTFVAMLPDQTYRWMNPNLRVYRAEVAISTAHPGMRPGMSCAVEILVEDLADALHVPVQSVFRDRRGTVCFVTRGGRIERREVVVGRFNDLWAEITAGLVEGETVRLHPPPGFEPSVPESHDPGEPGAEQPAGGSPSR